MDHFFSAAVSPFWSTNHRGRGGSG